MKVLIIEGNAPTATFLIANISHLVPEAGIILASTRREVREALLSNDFKVAILDGYLGACFHGRNVLEAMSPEQSKKTIVFSSEEDFLSSANSQGIHTISKERSSELLANVVEKLKKPA